MIRIEPYRGERLGGVVNVLRSALGADDILRSQFVRKALLDPNFEPKGAPVALVDAEVVGFGLSIARRVPLEDAPRDTDRGFITLLAVLPGHRRQGAGALLLAHMEAFLRAMGRSTVLISPYAPGYFTPGVDVGAYAEGLAFLKGRAYAEVYRPIAMECDLAQLMRPAWLDARVGAATWRTEPYRAEIVPELMAFVREQFPGDWQRVFRTACDQIEMGDVPTRVWIARDGDRIIGCAHSDGERLGPIGVASDRRGQAVGHALMFDALHAMRDRGLVRAWFMWSDDRTAKRLYQTAGFNVARTFAVLRKELPD